MTLDTTRQTKRPFIGKIEQDWTTLDLAGYCLAEGEGFEPPGPCGPTDFKSAAFDRSANPPGLKNAFPPAF